MVTRGGGWAHVHGVPLAGCPTLWRTRPIWGGPLWSQKHLRGAKSIERRMSTQHLEHSRCGEKLCRMNQ